MRLFIVLVVAGLIVGGLISLNAILSRPGEKALQAVPSPSHAPLPTEEQLSSVVERFYASYLECLENPPKDKKLELSKYCQENNSNISKEFVSNLNKSKVKIDPVVCAQNTPLGFKVVSPEALTLSAVVLESFGESDPVQITIKVVEEEEALKVDNIICPSP